MVNLSTILITSNSTLDDQYGVYVIDATSQNLTLTLTDITSYDGTYLIVKRIDSSANTVTIQGTSSQTINGSSTLVLTPNSRQSLVSLGNAWYY